MRFTGPSRARDIGGVQPIAESGTALAILDYPMSGAAICVSPVITAGKQRREGWGGPRNRRDRTSEFLDPSKARELVEAAAFAWAIGLPLNRFITIHWERASIPDHRAALAVRRFVKLAGDWIAKNGGRLACVWVRENDYGDGTKGSHAHILMHVPAGLTLGRRQWGWLRRITGKRYRKGVIKTECIGGTASTAIGAPDVYDVNLHKVLGYACKGAPPEALARLQLPHRHQPGGRVIGKRSGTSENIGRNARER